MAIAQAILDRTVEVSLRGVRGGTIVARLRPQVEALRRLRNEGSQIVRVEHVHVNEGGQVVTGNVKSSGSESAEGVSAGGGYAPIRPNRV
jgi:hypothetical protein